MFILNFFREHLIKIETSNIQLKLSAKKLYNITINQLIFDEHIFSIKKILILNKENYIQDKNKYYSNHLLFARS